MAFNDNPIVDNYSKNCEDSVIAVKNLLRQKNGFICRSICPDFGIDEEVELILYNELTKEYKGASNKHFSLQLKSLDKHERDKFIEKNGVHYIKIQFESSRLGYILRKPPAYGIIVIYDIRDELLYFDYCENIYYNLNEIHKNDRWKNSEKPVIYIPTENILDQNSIINVHKFMVERHKNAQLCNIANASKYNIPIFEDNIVENEIDFHNPDTILHYLKNYGWNLIDINNFNLLKSMFEKLPHGTIMSSQDLLLLASVVNCEMGNIIDADFFLKKSELFEEFDTEKIEIKLFTRFKIEFALGRNDFEKFLVDLEKLKESVVNKHNKILIDLNIILIKLFSQSETQKFLKDIIKDIDELFLNIIKSEIDENKKHLLITFHTTIFNVYASKLIVNQVSEFHIRQTLRSTFRSMNSIPNRKELVEFITNFYDTSARYSMLTWKYAEETGNKYIKATSLYNLSDFFFLMTLNLSLFKENKVLKEDSRDFFEKNIDYAFTAEVIFKEISRFKEAYLSATIAYELTLLYEFLFNQTAQNESLKIEAHLKKIEKQMGILPYRSMVKDAFDKKEKVLENVTKYDLQIPESEFEALSESMINALNLPKVRQKNIISDLRSHKYFNENNKSESLELLQNIDHAKSDITLYSTLPLYTIRCQKCGRKSIQDSDVKQLLSLFSDHIC